MFSPEIKRRRLVLPHPFLPVTAKRSPGLTKNDTSGVAGVLLYQTRKPSPRTKIRLWCLSGAMPSASIFSTSRSSVCLCLAACSCLASVGFGAFHQLGRPVADIAAVNL
jgi:hypothetical protein